MPVPRKQRKGHRQQVNGLYVHSSPPRVLQINSAHIRQAIRSGDIEKLENIVYDGQGKKLIGEYASDYKVRSFLKTVPSLMSKVSLLHDAVNSGRLEELQSLLEDENEKNKKKLILAKDESGVGLLHKAVYYDLKDISEWILKNYPSAASLKDTDGRTAYHYTPMCQNPASIQKMLKSAGADPTVLDNRQRSARYYAEHISELELPNSHKSKLNSRRNTTVKDSLNIKKSNIRIWIHQRDLSSLQQVIWEGHGSRLLVEHSNNPRVKRFLEAIPHILGVITGVHTDVINNDLEGLKEKTAPPAPNALVIAKDSNGLTPLHKAAGLGLQEVAEYIISQNPKSVVLVDNEGRTPLHYSVLSKDGGKMFDYLVDAGADEGALDNKSKSAAFYKTRTHELDSKVLQVIPECPRKAREQAPLDWNVLGIAATPTEEMAKIISPAEDAFGKENENAEETNGEEINGNEEETNGNVDEEVNNNAENGDTAENGEANSNNEEPEEKDEPKEAENEEEAKVDEPAAEEEPASAAEEEHTTTAEEETEAAPKEEENEIVPKEEETEVEPKEEETEEASKEEEAEVESKEEQTEEAPTEEEETEAAPKEEENEVAAGEKETGEAAEEETHSPAEEEEETEKDKEVEESETENADEKPENIEEENAEEEMIENLAEAIVEGEGVIEGIVNGENEIESVNEEGQGAADDGKDDAEIAAMVEEGNMEHLAGLVLNGEGERLMGHTSDIPELQSFLDNVQVYMAKINRIHLAARDGSLKELQAALDRRKFAIAKDKISPNGASPLHVAIVFGNTSIVRYLAGRFPETVGVTDDNSRSPLHYAAVVPDNGHYYNLLVHLGANTRTEDKFGNTPEFYRVNAGDFNHNNLLRDFGAEVISEEMLSDKDAPNAPVEMPFFCTEEGRYLASSLGDPLIKGLTEVANKRPADPIAYLAQYLYNFANNNNNRAKSRGRTQENQQIITAGSPANVDTNNAVPANIDVVTLEPEEMSNPEESAFNATSRDEHGQSMLHFAAARSHGRNALYQLLTETEINIGFRDELYRTARDISIQANIPENTVEIDRYVLQIASKGDTDKLVELLLDGYDHIIDIIDEDGIPIIEAVGNAEQPDTVAFLHSILAFEERRERVHHAIREGNMAEIKEMLADENETGSGKLLAIGKNSYGRCTLHIAVLCQQEEIVDYLANTFNDTLRIGDNLERTALHYALGIEKIESISRVLVKAGAERVAKDLKGRQPTYYFMNKSDILRLQEEEETF